MLRSAEILGGLGVRKDSTKAIGKKEYKRKKIEQEKVRNQILKFRESMKFKETVQVQKENEEQPNHMRPSASPLLWTSPCLRKPYFSSPTKFSA